MIYKNTIKYILLAVLLFAFIPNFGQNSNQFKVVLDAGHGGKDPGAMKNGLKEKEIALDVVLRVGKLLEAYNDVALVYTRKTDVFIELRERANIANRAKANLFVSVHCNSTTTAVPYGSMTLVMGMSRTGTNLEIAKTENAVIFQEADYKTKYKGFDPNNPETLIGLKIMQEESLLQSIELASLIQDGFKTKLNRKDKGVHQQPLWVLDATVMPGVLIELGFVSNPEEAKYLSSEEGKAELAQSIANSIIAYKNTFFSPSEVALPLDVQDELIVVPENTIPTENNVVVNSDKTTHYKVQLEAGTKLIDTKPANFKGLKNISYTHENKLYKYFYGDETDYEACKKLLEEAKKKGYKSAYIVTFENK